MNGTADAPPAARPWDADEAVTALYAAQYRSLVRLAALLLRDTAAAEEVVQDAFVAMHGRWGRLREPDRAVGYLRQAVVNCRATRVRRAALPSGLHVRRPAAQPGTPQGRRR